MTIRRVQDSTARPVAQKTLERIERAVRSVEASGASYIPNVRSNGPRLGKASLEETGDWEIPEDSRWSFELGHLDDEDEWQGSGVFVEAYNLGEGYVFEDNVYRLEFFAGRWTCEVFAPGILEGTTQEAIAANTTGTVDVERLGEVELENWSGQNVATGKDCVVGWNPEKQEWRIVSVDC